MTWIKLPNVGDTHDAVIRQCGYHAGKIGRPTVRFQTMNGDDLYVPVAEAHEALVRIFGGNAAGEPNYDDVIMQRLTFSRRKPASETDLPSWSIELLDAPHSTGEGAMDNATRQAIGDVQRQDAAREKVNLAYIDALQKAFEIQSRIFAPKKGKKIPVVTAESVQAGAATLLIQWERQRCL